MRIPGIHINAAIAIAIGVAAPWFSGYFRDKIVYIFVIVQLFCGQIIVYAIVFVRIGGVLRR